MNGWMVQADHIHWINYLHLCGTCTAPKMIVLIRVSSGILMWSVKDQCGLIICFCCSDVNEVCSRYVRVATMKQLPKQEWFYRGRPSIFVPFSSFGSVSVNTGSIRRYLDHIEVLQVIHSFRMTHGIARRFAVCVARFAILGISLGGGMLCWGGHLCCLLCWGKGTLLHVLSLGSGWEGNKNR